MTAQADLKISEKLQDLARAIDSVLFAVAGEPVRFSLFVWSEGRSQYVSNVQRPDVITAVEETVARWKAGMPDVPAHKVQ